jgi:alkylation response protein AidB-like acyl-CoA dehydrogenase
MNFEFTDDQRAIKRTARDFLAARYRLETVRELAASELGSTDEQWREIAELGWPGVIVAEDHGGLGLGAVELVVIQEEMGYALAPSPFFSSICATLLLAAAGTDEQRDKWLPRLASGEARGTLAVWDEGSGWAPDHSEAEPAAGALSAAKIAVPDAATADLLLVAGADGHHYLLESDAPSVSIVRQKSLDPTRKLYKVVLDGAPVEPLAHEPERVAHAYATIVTALAAENVGVAQRAMEMAVEYAGDRKQFDRPIGSFQSIAHRCAQMLLEVEGARSLAYWAGWALDQPDDATAVRAASMAKAYASDAGFRVTASSVQVHGGIGFTWEHDLHFFLKRAKANAYAFGDARWHRDRVVTLAGV